MELQEKINKVVSVFEDKLDYLNRTERNEYGLNTVDIIKKKLNLVIETIKELKEITDESARKD